MLQEKNVMMLEKNIMIVKEEIKEKIVMMRKKFSLTTKY